MTAEPKQESFEEEFEDLDEFDEEENERGLSGLVVLLMGVIMLGAFASVVWIAYQQGIKNGASVSGSPPTIAADPEPVKIENQVADAAKAGNDRTVYDRVGGTPEGPEVIASGPEEPIARGDAPASGSSVVDDAVQDRIVALAAQDAALETQPAPAAEPAPAVRPVTEPTPATAVEPAPTPAAGDALSGSHVVQVGAFKSDAEATGHWTAMQRRFGEYLDGKADHVERADLGDKGVFYRLRIGPFASSADAKTWCDGLKSRGGDCMVKAK